jgi:HSP20 family molecular chaperone IbpA
MKDASAEANQRAQQHFQDKFKHTVQEQANVIDGMENRASQQIRSIRKDTSEKLAAYSSRQSDPFYRMKEVGARLHDEGDAFVLTATIPDYEQKHVNVTIRGNQIVISGYRNNEEKLEESPGHVLGTNSFQSFEESFPLNWPVNAKELTREFHGDRLIARVPKQGQYAKPGPYQGPKPAKARVEPPHFPPNIHVAENESPKEDAPSKKNGGSGVLN